MAHRHRLRGLDGRARDPERRSKRMVHTIRVVTLYLVSWVGIPLAFTALLATIYSITLKFGRLPFLGSGEWAWWVIFIGCLAGGAACLVRAHLQHRFVRILMPILYCVIMGVVLLILNLGVSCHKGDCL